MPQDPRKNGFTAYASALVMAMAGSGIFAEPGLPQDPLAGIDIAAEYQLIQRKASRLSANTRRLVVVEYLRRQKKVMTEQDVIDTTQTK